MFEIEDQKPPSADEPPLVNVKAPTEFPHSWHVYASVLTCGLWLPFYVAHLILARLWRKS